MSTWGEAGRCREMQGDIGTYREPLRADPLEHLVGVRVRVRVRVRLRVRVRACLGEGLGLGSGLGPGQG